MACSLGLVKVVAGACLPREEGALPLHLSCRSQLSARLLGAWGRELRGKVRPNSKSLHKLLPLPPLCDLLTCNVVSCQWPLIVTGRCFYRKQLQVLLGNGKSMNTFSVIHLFSTLLDIILHIRWVVDKYFSEDNNILNT